MVTFYIFFSRFTHGVGVVVTLTQLRLAYLDSQKKNLLDSGFLSRITY